MISEDYEEITALIVNLISKTIRRRISEGKRGIPLHSRAKYWRARRRKAA